MPAELPEIRAKEVAAGMAHTVAVGFPVLRNGVVCKGAPSVFMWGRCKSMSQDAWMYPKPEDDLRGWQVHCHAVGHFHNVMHADSSVIVWGNGCASGELGFGVGGPKSSARPKKVDILETAKVPQVACGVANTVLLAERSAVIDALPEYTPTEVVTVADDDAGKGGKGKSPATKRKWAPAASNADGKKKK